MIDITKEEFWETRYEELTQREEKDNKLIKTIKNNKFITTLLISLAILMTINTILIYNFFSILSNM